MRCQQFYFCFIFLQKKITPATKTYDCYGNDCYGNVYNKVSPVIPTFTRGTICNQSATNLQRIQNYRKKAYLKRQAIDQIYYENKKKRLFHQYRHTPTYSYPNRQDFRNDHTFRSAHSSSNHLQRSSVLPPNASKNPSSYAASLVLPHNASTNPSSYTQLSVSRVPSSTQRSLNVPTNSSVPSSNLIHVPINSLHRTPGHKIQEQRNKVCSHCNLAAYLICSGCRLIWYCSRQCQVIIIIISFSSY